jgi:predicted solute-binding protein
VQRQSYEMWNGALGEAVKALSSAKTWGLSHLEDVCSGALRKGILTISELKDYYSSLKYDLADKEQGGLQRFYEYLVQIGEIGSCPRLEIFSPLACVA